MNHSINFNLLMESLFIFFIFEKMYQEFHLCLIRNILPFSFLNHFHLSMCFDLTLICVFLTVIALKNNLDFYLILSLCSLPMIVLD